ncbi:hypothetical protein PR048_024674 [Dryococelus australis]|uniref:Uncharacterized protein n=1 Tax=Dryococelus australis TaxID=614101 RepID=A0ABQ9GP98_9NEOP|nr:hypothetical protein PR048_024674 [Dryococelus australis]
MAAVIRDAELLHFEQVQLFKRLHHFRTTSLYCAPIGCFQSGEIWPGEAGDLRENPPTSGIVRHDSHMLKSESGSPRWEASDLTITSPRPPNKLRFFVFVFQSLFLLLPNCDAPCVRLEQQCIDAGVASAKVDNSRTTGSEGRMSAKLNEVDVLVLKIVGKDSPVISGLGVPSSFEKDSADVSMYHRVCYQKHFNLRHVPIHIPVILKPIMSTNCQTVNRMISMPININCLILSWCINFNKCTIYGPTYHWHSSNLMELLACILYITRPLNYGLRLTDTCCQSMIDDLTGSRVTELGDAYLTRHGTGASEPKGDTGTHIKRRIATMREALNYRASLLSNRRRLESRPVAAVTNQVALGPGRRSVFEAAGRRTSHAIR